MTLVPALGRQTQEALQEFKASLVYRVIQSECKERLQSDTEKPCLEGKKTPKQQQKQTTTKS